MKKEIHREEEIQLEWKKMAENEGDAEKLVTDGLCFSVASPTTGKAAGTATKATRSRFGPTHRTACSSLPRISTMKRAGISVRRQDVNTLAYSYERAVPFYKNLRMWSYGLMKTTADGYPPFEEARDMEKSGPFYETAPIARVNCKKQVGSASVDDKVLMRYLETYTTPLRKQMAFYDANTILCCGCQGDHNLILDFVKSQYIIDLAPIPDSGDWVYYSPSTGKIAINSYHPSARIGYEDTYNEMMCALQSSLKYIKEHSK